MIISGEVIIIIIAIIVIIVIIVSIVIIVIIVTNKMSIMMHDAFIIITWKEQEDRICMLEMLSKDTDWLIYK